MLTGMATIPFSSKLACQPELVAQLLVVYFIAQDQTKSHDGRVLFLQVPTP